jgi:hypothetical protein
MRRLKPHMSKSPDLVIASLQRIFAMLPSGNLRVGCREILHVLRRFFAFVRFVCCSCVRMANAEKFVFLLITCIQLMFCTLLSMCLKLHVL